MAEILWQLWLNIFYIFRIEIEQLLAGTRVKLPIIFYVLVEAGQIVESKFVRDREHLRFCFLEFLQSDLMNLIRSEIGRRHAPNLKPIPPLAIGQSPYARFTAAAGCIFRAHESREALVCRNHLGRNYCQCLLAKSLLIL